MTPDRLAALLLALSALALTLAIIGVATGSVLLLKSAFILTLGMLVVALMLAAYSLWNDD